MRPSSQPMKPLRRQASPPVRSSNRGSAAWKGASQSPAARPLRSLEPADQGSLVFGLRRGAPGLCSPLFQVLLTFYCWADDAAWAVPAWERVVATLALGDGRQLASPAEHWALRGKH